MLPLRSLPLDVQQRVLRLAFSAQPGLDVPDDGFFVLIGSAECVPLELAQQEQLLGVRCDDQLLLVLGFCCRDVVPVNAAPLMRVRCLHVFTAARGHDLGRAMLQRLGPCLPWQPLSTAYWGKVQERLGWDFAGMIMACTRTPAACRFFCSTFLDWTDAQADELLLTRAGAAPTVNAPMCCCCLT